MNKKDSIGDRMKLFYESRYRIKLTRRIPVILRLDGKAFHTLTRRCIKPFDDFFIRCMTDTAEFLLQEIQGCKCAYVQSDEISLLLIDFDTIYTDSWFDYNLQKITSISSSFASVQFTKLYGDIGYFDCRAFNVPKEDVVNYFIWRQQDWERNSLQMLARSFFSHKELQNKGKEDIHEMLYTKNVNWNDLDNHLKNGIFIDKYDYGYKTDKKLIFKEDRDLINRHLCFI